MPEVFVKTVGGGYVQQPVDFQQRVPYQFFFCGGFFLEPAADVGEAVQDAVVSQVAVDN